MRFARRTTGITGGLLRRAARASSRMRRGSGWLAGWSCVLPLLAAVAPAASAWPDVLPGTARLAPMEELPAQIVRQWDRFLLGEIQRAKAERGRFWQRDHRSAEAYARSLADNRARLRRVIGAIDERVPVVEPELVAGLDRPALRAEAPAYEVFAVRWPVLPGVSGEGLLLRPRQAPVGCLVVVPDADQTPEMLAGLQPGVPPESQVARQWAEQGFLVLMPTLLDRRSRWAGDERLQIYTDQSHREWIYRQAGDVGRHPIGYEVQKIAAAVDWFVSAKGPAAGGRVRIGVAGYGEGGLLTLYAGALDERIDVVWVSGYFAPRERLWQEPLYRNVWSLLNEFGDAELAAMVAPRTLVVEHSRFPEVVHPSPPDPSHRQVRRVAGAGRIVTADFAEVEAEWRRAMTFAGGHAAGFTLVGGASPGGFGSAGAVRALTRAFGRADTADTPGRPPAVLGPVSAEEIDARQWRQVSELQEFTQARIRLAEYEREKFFWSRLPPTTPAAWNAAVRSFRERFWDEVIGRFPESPAPRQVRTRRLDEYSDARITAYEVLLNVQPGVDTWGYLLLPNDVQPGERRPVVVCQHGAGGQPKSTLDPEGAYRAFATRLAHRGFVVYAPYNPNKLLNEEFRQLQRKGNPLQKTVFGIFAANHQRVLGWLKQLDFVDPQRMAFYGLSYGGKTAVRVPPVLEDYCLSICSGDFNDYLPKVTSVRADKNSFMFVDSYENVQFNLGHMFNYAEMAALIAPRPFMVEHGYKDRVAPLEWAASEYSRVQRLYFLLGIPERTAMAFFDGPHMIHGEATFAFLHRHLRWRSP